ncbi:TetR/AcrR family transcriptional regulator [Methylocella tundrae]|uniref:TetR/AcrR family transcriptional regulator n=1 Tax=Methylocella tundrae TaxID=227605 RepID=A0A4V6IMK5_METTU|nr:TetR/AcrR family transcriptional regulator [Methylocella tundrae]WPP05920.1 TetR/AcrR family transcriptional regulator [Methylocella tundrae]VFU08466.1 TetR/AcrR family transcriptional regulator [Methylocella tundrae]
MARESLEQIKARKQPRQARAKATVDAIFEATIQVLLSDGLSRLTTTRVAERAGVSVGTMYQYFPQKQALLFALLARHIEAVADGVATARARCHGLSLETISDGLVEAYLDAKTKNLDAARALYAVAAEIDTDDLLGTVARRNQNAVCDVLKSAEDVTFDAPDEVAFTLRATLAGTTRAVLERGATRQELAAMRRELPILCRAYLCARAMRTLAPGCR